MLSVGNPFWPRYPGTGGAICPWGDFPLNGPPGRPFDPPSRSAWRTGARGYAAYKAGDSVMSHEAWGTNTVPATWSASVNSG